MTGRPCLLKSDLRSDRSVSSQRVPAAVGLFARLAKLLKKARVVRRRGPGPSNKRRFVTRMGRLWEGIGLKVTRVYDGMFEELLDSRFQEFGNAALSAVDADFQITSADVQRYKNYKRAKPRKILKSLR